ncbi:hypothetical protein [Acaryochloris marina]|uniref:Uncharacterized protein n=1 Tax=Acaryochloris marina (strain MBIC 11017) TaxID=329726 RepID=B0CEN6_ACAM1|nr:hypothetical protein [Acaryochloris marina]ABW28141.1 hypothetical protein AM1_3145 [Acaryochloris marina MBIC11017]
MDMNIKSRIYVVILTLLFSNFSTLVKAQIKAEDFDANGNQLVDNSEENNEQQKLVMKLINPSFLEIDIDPADGIVTLEEIKNAFNNDDIEISDPNNNDVKINRLKIANDELNSLRQKNDGQLTLEVANDYISKIVGPPPSIEKDGIAGSGIRLRRDIEDVTILDSLAPIQEADSAILNFTRDFEADNTIFTVRGGLFYPILTEINEEDLEPDKLTLTRYQITPGIEIDRVENSADAFDDEDILTFALNTDFEVQGSSVFPSQYFRGNFLYQTDSNFDSSIFGAQLQWEPKNRHIGLGQAQEIFGDALRFRWRAILETQLATVLDAGNITDRVDGDLLFRAGPKLEIEFFPANREAEFFGRLGLQAEYSFLQNIAGDGETSHLFSSTLSYRLDDTGNANLLVNYRVGDIDLTGQNVNELSIGLGLTF